MSEPWHLAAPRRAQDGSGDRPPAGTRVGQGRRRQESSRAWRPLIPSLPPVPSSPPALSRSPSRLSENSSPPLELPSHYWPGHRCLLGSFAPVALTDLGRVAVGQGPALLSSWRPAPSQSQVSGSGSQAALRIPPQVRPRHPDQKPSMAPHSA